MFPWTQDRIKIRREKARLHFYMLQFPGTESSPTYRELIQLLLSNHSMSYERLKVLLDFGESATGVTFRKVVMP